LIFASIGQDYYRKAQQKQDVFFLFKELILFKEMKNEPKKILLVEDDDILRDVYKHYFEKEGFWVYSVNNGPDAVAFTENQEFDIVLLDIIIPGFDGFTVLRKIRENQKTSKMPVMIMTNLDEDKYMTRALKLGANEYLIKANTTPDVATAHIKTIISKES
jgi:DNA-binding response OmpR family regulator